MTNWSGAVSLGNFHFGVDVAEGATTVVALSQHSPGHWVAIGEATGEFGEALHAIIADLVRLQSMEPREG